MPSRSVPTLRISAIVSVVALLPEASNFLSTAMLPSALWGSKRPNNLTGVAEGLLGYVDTLTTYNYGDKTRLHQNAWSAFVADEWRLTRKLNITLGLRYEYSPNWLNEGDLTTNFDLDAGKILVPDTTKKLRAEYRWSSRSCTALKLPVRLPIKRLSAQRSHRLRTTNGFAYSIHSDGRVPRKLRPLLRSLSCALHEQPDRSPIQLPASGYR